MGCSLIKYPTYQPSIPPSDLIEMVRESNGKIRSIRGIGRVEVVSQGKKIRARQFIALAKPDMMRVDLLNPLDLPYLRLAFRGKSFQAMDMRENVFYIGDVAKGLSLFVPLRVTSKEFIAFIFGEMPDQDNVSPQYDPHRGLYQVTFPPSTRWESQIFWIHPKTLKVVEVSKTDGFEGDLIRVSFSKFRKIDSMTFPRRIQIEVPGNNNRIQFNFSKVEVNLPLPQELFRLSIPPGAEVVEIDERMNRERPAFPVNEYTEE